MRVLLCGEKSVAEGCLQFLVNRPDTEVCGIVAAPTDWQADLISWGAKRRIKVFVGNINDYLNELIPMKLDFIFSVQYRPLLKRPILELPRLGCINLHFGLLPRYGGCYPIAWAILNNESEAGATLHYMVEKFDEGDVISQVKVPIDANTTARSLFDTLSSAAVGLFMDTYPALCSGEIRPRAQDLSEKLYYPEGSIDFNKDSKIQWRQNAGDIQRKICAFTFEPFQMPSSFLRLSGGNRLKVKVSQSRLGDERPGDLRKRPGEVRKVTGSGEIIIATGNNESICVGLLDGQIARDFFVSLGVEPEKAVFE